MSSHSQQGQARLTSANLQPLTPLLQSSSRPMLPSIEPSEHANQFSRPGASQTSQSPVTSLFRVPQSPRTTNHADPRAAKAAKVAIPRLKRSFDSSVDGTTRSGGRHRVNHACEPCRHRKTKCSGERPICRHCEDFKIACFYADGKRDRVKKQFGSMTEKVADYERLLRDLVGRVGDSDARIIRVMLEKVDACQDREDYGSKLQDTHPEFDESEADGYTVRSAEADRGSESGGENDASAGVGSTGALDKTDEDFTRDSALTTGFMGKNSEVTWLQRLRLENKEESTPLGGNIEERGMPLAEADEDFSIKRSSYHLDDFAISTYEAVDPYETPTQETASQLFHAYVTRVHPSFPIIGKATLTSQFHKFMAGQIQRPPAPWLAILNLIFAISAKYSHLIRAEWEGDERDHLIYFSRARLLGMNGESIFSHPDLQQIQTQGLMAFYFLCTSQVNRSWAFGGMALRSATALGMNMRNDSARLSDGLKEIRYRVWWALYTLEHRLCSMTGRMSCILDEHCTTPLPIPLDEDDFESNVGKSLLKKEKQAQERNPASQTPSGSSTRSSAEPLRSSSKLEMSRSPTSQQQQRNLDLEWAKSVAPNNSLYFLHLVQLTRVSQNIFHQLYNPTSVTGTWAEIQTLIASLEVAVEVWYRNLPPILDFKRKQREKDFYECRLNLGFFYYGTRITITRPCLCRLDRKIAHQSSKSSDFNRNTAAGCVEAAQAMLRLIPDEPNAVGLNSVGPWWNILHWLVQATTVLMLEISFRAYHMPEEADNIFESSKKGVRWMHQMGEENVSARRAWRLCNAMLRDAARKIGREITDLPERPPAGRSSMSSASNSIAAGAYPTAEVPAMLFSPAQSMPTFQAYADYDRLMQYDQYFPTGEPMADGIDYPHPIPGEMEFMSHAYHDGQSHEHNNTGAMSRQYN